MQSAYCWGSGTPDPLAACAGLDELAAREPVDPPHAPSKIATPVAASADASLAFMVMGLLVIDRRVMCRLFTRRLFTPVARGPLTRCDRRCAMLGACVCGERSGCG
jgi:hypothetical protein